MAELSYKVPEKENNMLKNQLQVLGSVENANGSFLIIIKIKFQYWGGTFFWYSNQFHSYFVSKRAFKFASLLQ